MFNLLLQQLSVFEQEMAHFVRELMLREQHVLVQWKSLNYKSTIM